MIWCCVVAGICAFFNRNTFNILESICTYIFFFFYDGHYIPDALIQSDLQARSSIQALEWEATLAKTLSGIHRWKLA